MHFERTSSCRIGKAEDRHRDLICSEPNRRAERRAGTLGLATFRVCAIGCTDGSPKQVVNERCGKVKLLSRQGTAQHETGKRLCREFVRIPLLATFLPVTRVMSATRQIGRASCRERV